MRRFIFFLMTLVLVSVPVFGATLTASFAPPADPDVAGFRVYATQTQGVYVFVKDNPTDNNLLGEAAANETSKSFTIAGAGPGLTPYWFVSTSYDTSGNESAPSPEIGPINIPDEVAPGPPQFEIRLIMTANPDGTYTFSAVAIPIRR